MDIGLKIRPPKSRPLTNMLKCNSKAVRLLILDELLNVFLSMPPTCLKGNLGRSEEGFGVGGLNQEPHFS